MRGFGVTGADFAIECHMDKVAHEIGMNPVELRILNAYRDGDMKAHRREAKNCALIECCQVAAEKAGWGIRDEFKQMSSLRDGGGERARIPDTVTDETGKIGERRSGRTGDGRTTVLPPPAPTPPPTVQTPPAAPPETMPPAPAAAPPQPIPSAAPPVAPEPTPPAPPPPPEGAPTRTTSRPINRPGYSRFASNSGFRRR